MSDDEDIRLRDQFAIAAMQALLSQYKQLCHTTEYGNANSSGNEYNRTETINTTFNTFETEHNRDYIARINSKIELISHLSYKIADEMRKARLRSFT